MKTVLLIAGLSILSLQAFGAERERDCRRGRITINIHEQTDKEGFVRVFQLLATAPLRDSFKVELPRFNPATGERPLTRTTNLTLFDAFPNAKGTMKEELRLQLNEAVDQLSQIPGVEATCGELPAETHPRLGGGF